MPAFCNTIGFNRMPHTSGFEVLLCLTDRLGWLRDRMGVIGEEYVLLSGSYYLSLSILGRENVC
jgi:hypothetical protein